MKVDITIRMADPEDSDTAVEATFRDVDLEHVFASPTTDESIRAVAELYESHLEKLENVRDLERELEGGAA